MPSTPGRKTVVTIDVPIYALQEPAYGQDWEFEKISPGGKEFSEYVSLLPRVGWRLTSFHQELAQVHEAGAADGARITPTNGNVTVSPGLFEVGTQRWKSELLDVNQGQQRTSGNLYLRKRVRASASWQDSLLADLSAFSAPDTASDMTDLDRVLLTNTAHNPDQPLAFTLLWTSKHPVTVTGTIAKLYFCGIPGSLKKDGLDGKGQYCLRLSGDGVATLWERLTDNSWKIRRLFRWNPPTGAGVTVIHVASDAYMDPATGKWTGNKLLFDFGAVTGNSLLALDLSAYTNSINGPRWQVYQIPAKTGLSPSLTPARLDVRRDLRATFALDYWLYRPSGTLHTYTWTLPFSPSGGGGTPEMRVDFIGNLPVGTNVTVQAFNASTNAAVSAGTTAPVIGPYGGSTYFLCDAGQKAYYAILTLTTSNQSVSPTIERIRILRNRQNNLTTPTPISPTTVEEISITSPDTDPSHETSSYFIRDRAAALTVLRTRSAMPHRIEVQYDPNDVTKTSTLTQGLIVQAKGRRRTSAKNDGRGTGDPVVYPSADWRDWTVRAVGEWQRAMEQQAPFTHDWGLDASALGSLEVGPGGKVGYKITDIVRILLGVMGYPDFMIDVPNMPIRYFPSTGDNPTLIEVCSQIAPVIIQLVRDYLGGYLIFDANATNGGPANNKFGCWRVIIPPRPDGSGNFNNLAAFFLGPNASVLAAPFAPGAYTDGTGPGSQVIKGTGVRFGSFYDYVVPPEANLIIVTGSGFLGPDDTPAGTLERLDGKVQLTQSAANYVSAQFSPTQTTPPDPSHPDYLGRVVPLFYGDPGLNSTKAVNFTLRRLYDMVVHAQKRVQFEGPMILVTDVTDTKQLRPRPLRFGDPVLFDNAQFIVGSVNIDYHGKRGGDRFQHAAYELFSVPFLQNYAAAVGRA